ncbi:50S ribosomal protein L9 [Candidatus Termititenax dinenymphae]|uniref:Large ribosomal subunit protein bL9 n=1 Tax=Candidatus Termititenax dinenymphae TaxID=2218523 RepID=A0A388TL10_9BACT|nr:50S ribosomal protein L9 [Candidatus Termititenax dinenymphae]
MEVILIKDTEYGDKGAVVKVTSGYARNFLFPNGVAVPHNPGNLQHVESIAAQRAKKIEKEKAEVQAVADKLQKLATVEIKAKGSEGGQLFGAITHQQIADAINAAAGTEIDRRRIQLKSVKEAGAYTVPVKLTFGITAAAKLKVIAEVDKKAETAARKARKPRKKEEIAAEIEAQEQAAAAKETDVSKEEA